MTRPDSGFVPLADGGRLAYRIDGPAGGFPVLLVRPLGGSMRLWGTFRDNLATRHRVVSYDHRGGGCSSRAPAVRSTEALARDASSLLDYFGIERTHVFGISLGGMVATWLAAKEPAKVARLCLTSAPVRGLDLSGGGVQRELALAACFLLRSGEVEAALVRRVLSRRFRSSNPREVERIVRVVKTEPIATTRRVLLARAGAGIFHDASDAARSIVCPTLVLRGGDDILLGPRDARDLAGAIPRATLETISAVGHDPTLEAPEQTAARVARFFTPNH